MKTKLLRRRIVTSQGGPCSGKCTVKRLFKVNGLYNVIPTENVIRRMAKNCGLNPDHMFCTIGTAACSPKDKYDPEKGEKIASMRSVTEALGRYRKFLLLSEGLLQGKVQDIKDERKKTEEYMKKCRDIIYDE